METYVAKVKDPKTGKIGYLNGDEDTLHFWLEDTPTHCNRFSKNDEQAAKSRAEYNDLEFVCLQNLEEGLFTAPEQVKQDSKEKGLYTEESKTTKTILDDIKDVINANLSGKVKAETAGDDEIVGIKLTRKGNEDLISMFDSIVKALSDNNIPKTDYEIDLIGNSLILGMKNKQLEEAKSVEDTIQDLVHNDDKFKYAMLDRLRMDCDYFLGYGNGYEKDLWAKNVKDHIAIMKALYNSFKDEDKPEWISMKDIERYESDMNDKLAKNQSKVQESEEKEIREIEQEIEDGEKNNTLKGQEKIDLYNDIKDIKNKAEREKRPLTEKVDETEGVNEYKNLKESNDNIEWQDITKDDIELYMDTWDNYTNYKGDVQNIKGGWMNIDDAKQFVLDHEEEDPMIEDRSCKKQNIELLQNINEYSNAAKAIEDIELFINSDSQEVVDAILQTGEPLENALQIVEDGAVMYFSGVFTEKQLAHAYIDISGSIMDSISKDKILSYINEDLIISDYFDNEEPDDILSEVVEDIIQNNIDNEDWLSQYFDYERYGRDMVFSGYVFTTFGAVYVF